MIGGFLNWLATCTSLSVGLASLCFSSFLLSQEGGPGGKQQKGVTTHRGGELGAVVQALVAWVVSVRSGVWCAGRRSRGPYTDSPLFSFVSHTPPLTRRTPHCGCVLTVRL